MFKRLIIAFMVLLLVGTYTIHADDGRRKYERDKYEEEHHDYKDDDDDDYEDDEDDDDEHEDGDEHEDDEDADDKYQDGDDENEYEDDEEGQYEHDNDEDSVEFVANQQWPQVIAVKLADRQDTLFVSPINNNGIVLAPALELIEYFDAEYLLYDNGILELFAENRHYVFHADKRVVYVDGNKQLLSTPPMMNNGSYYLPLEQFITLLKLNLTWIEDQHTLLATRGE